MFTIKKLFFQAAASSNKFSYINKNSLNKSFYLSVSYFMTSSFNMGQNTSAGNSNVVEKFVCNVSEMKDGEMKEVEFDEGMGKALLVRSEGEFSAIGPKCTHFGAPLIKGTLYKNTVRCPWHGACFNVKTGDIEDYPGLDCVPKHEVVIKGAQVFVRAEVDSLKSHKRYKPMVQEVDTNGQHVVIIGGGPASVTCAETLRQKSFTGPITIVTREKHIPYDRTKLSKAMDIDPEKIYLRPQQFYDSVNIKVMKNSNATEVNLKEKIVGFQDGNCIKYDKLVIATGGSPRSLPIPGWELENVFVLRTPADAKAIVKAATEKNVVICGASFIGMEVASYLASKANKVSVCEFFKVPFERVLGKEVGQFLQNMHENKGVEFHMGTSMEEIIGDDKKVKQIKLKGGQTIDCDVLVAGVGVIPSTAFLQKETSSAISMTKQGFVNTDKYLRVLDTDNKVIPDVYAAGDIVMYPQKLRDWQPSNIQHYQMAQFHGRTVGNNLVLSEIDLKQVDSVPFFWTVQYGKSIRYTGYGFGYDDIVIRGSLEEGKFCAYYTKEDKVVAVATLGMDPLAAEVASKMQNGQVLLKADL